MGFPSDLPNVVVGFQAAISRFVAEANDDPKPFTWLAEAPRAASGQSATKATEQSNLNE
jgi:hypothetical protein